MKRFLFPVLAAFALISVPGVMRAADAKAELQDLVGKVRAKLSQGKPTEEGLAEELKAFDTLLAEHQSEKTEDVATIAVMRAMLFAQVLDNDTKAVALLKGIQTEFPETAVGKRVPELVSNIESQSAAKAIQRTLGAGAPFPGFEEQDLDGKPLSVAQYQGKVVLIDFWATWCGPCVAELPNVLKAYDKYHGQGFEIIGISLDQEKAKLTSFIGEKKMAWPQYFDGKGWQSRLASKYGVDSIPATYLLDKEGKIIASGLRGAALDEAIAKALK